MFDVKDMLDVRSNKVWDEETAVPPALVENDKESELNGGKQDKDLKKTEGNGHGGSLAAAEALQAATDERRGKEVTKIKHRENRYRHFWTFDVGGDCVSQR